MGDHQFVCVCVCVLLFVGFKSGCGVHRLHMGEEMFVVVVVVTVPAAC